MKREILDGKTFGEWTVLKYAGDKKQLCRCSCGEIREVSTLSLTQGRSKSCGNKAKHPVEGQKKFKDLTNQRFGKLVALRYLGDTMWECRCDCGEVIIKSWKHLTNNSKCSKCARGTHSEKVLSKPEVNESKRQPINMMGYQTNDLTVIAKIGTDRYLCKCVCGAEVEVRGYSLRHPKTPSSYTCRHTDIIGKRFGKLTVVKRLPYQICRCRCDCGNIKDIWIGNLLNNSTLSCGCMRVPDYSKEQVLESIQKYINQNNCKPFTSELAEILGIGMTTMYSYIHNYDLKEYMNTYYGSVGEKEIATKMMKKFDIKLHDRKILNGEELDIYIPDKKIAIEFNGTYWHSSLNKEKNYHQSKTLRCIKQGIRLIHIFEYEWDNPEYRCKIEALLDGILGESRVIYARNLNIVEVSLSEAQVFESLNHLQGKAVSAINIALVENSNIVGLMTFGKPRFDSNYEYELIRLCYSNNVNIVGGAERMLKYFIDKYKPKSILTYCNLAKFTGNVYNRLGFKVVKDNPISEPNYVWVGPKSTPVLTRYQTMKKDLVREGLGDPEMTEDEIMQNHGFYKIYDSGNLRLELTLN